LWWIEWAKVGYIFGKTAGSLRSMLSASGGIIQAEAYSLGNVPLRFNGTDVQGVSLSFYQKKEPPLYRDGSLSSMYS